MGHHCHALSLIAVFVYPGADYTVLLLHKFLFCCLIVIFTSLHTLNNWFELAVIFTAV